MREARPAQGPRSASLRARLVAGFARRFVRPRSVHEPDPLASRAFVNRFAWPPPPGVSVRPARLGGVPGEWLLSRRPGPRTLVFLHGGAFVACSPGTHRPMTSAFARRGFRVFAPAYRLAPEHPFPAALDDVVSVYRALLDEGLDPGTIALGGDSAGGGLALSALVRLRELSWPLPAAAILFSPWTDLAGTGASLRTNAGRDPLFDPSHFTAVAGHYLGTADPLTSLASPLHADLGGLPPILLHVGESEILRDDSVRVAERVRAAGGIAEIDVVAVVPHGWQMLAAILPEARRSVDAAAAFLRAHMAAGPRPAP